jgi:GNAT superfamily N-acetyltransferase
MPRKTPVVVVREPTECTKTQRDAFVAMASRSGEVTRANIELGVAAARYLIWIEADDKLIGVATIKNAADTYRKGVFKKAGVSGRADGFRCEFGYLYVDPKHRDGGNGRALLDRAMSLVGSESVFATTRANNKAMNKALPRRSFERLGKKYPSKDNPKRFLYLYARTGLGADSSKSHVKRA